MTGSKIAAAFALVVTGVIIADILIHPAGTTAAANGVATILTPTYSALLGGGVGPGITGAIQR